MSTLYVNGQSTCYGMDLKPGKPGISIREYREANNFAGLLGRKLGYTVVNNSYPKSSMRTLIRKVTEEYDIVNPDLVVIGIPQATLREIWDPTINSYVNIIQDEFYFPPGVIHLDENGIPKVYDTDVQRKAYVDYRKGLTLEKAISDFENEVVELQTFLKSRNAKYIFVQMAPVVPNLIDEHGYTNTENTIKNFSRYFTKLQEIDTEKWIDFDNFNAVDNLRHVKKGRSGHLLEEGHEILRDLIYDKLANTYLHN